MKKFLISFLVFLLTVTCVQYIVYRVFKQVLDRNSQFRITRYFRSPNHKYFVLGNSRAVNSIDEKFATEKLKVDILNLSFNGEPYKNVLSMLDDVNSKNTNSTIFLEITCLNNDQFDNSYAYYIPNSPFIRRQFFGTIYSIPNLLRLNSELFLRNLYYLNKSDNDWVNNTTITSNFIEQIKLDSNFQVFPDQKAFSYKLDELQKRCNKYGNHLIFFLAPYYPAYIGKVIDYNRTVNYMAQNQQRYKFVDLNKVKLANYMFADRVHTNTKGAVLLTQYLLSVANPTDKSSK